MSTPPKSSASHSLAPPAPLTLPPQLPITPVRHDKDKENCFSPSALRLPCFRLVTADGLQVTLEPMDGRQAQLQYIDYKLNVLQGRAREGRKRRNLGAASGADEAMADESPSPPIHHHAAAARDRENRPQQPRLTSPPKPHRAATTTATATASGFSHSSPSFTIHSSGGSVVVQAAGAARTPSRKPLLPRFPPNPLMVAKANSTATTPSRQRRAQ